MKKKLKKILKYLQFIFQLDLDYKKPPPSLLIPKMYATKQICQDAAQLSFGKKDLINSFGRWK